MNPKKAAVPSIKANAGKDSPAFAVVGKSLAATLVTIGVIGFILNFLSGGALWAFHKSGDVVEQSDAIARAAVFASLAPLPLSLVPDREVGAALDGMGLNPPDKAALLAKLQPPGPSAKAADVGQPSAESSPAATTAAAPDAAPAAATVPLPAAAPVPVLAPKPRTSQNERLAWVTLWDTDAEDGDVVRLDSQGYSRTVTLMKKPVTFAVPVPRDGVIRVTGIRDGEGGGITVGFASGASSAVFPIMSVGQTLGLKVLFAP
jgi:hypothetical protein